MRKSIIFILILIGLSAYPVQAQTAEPTATSKPLTLLWQTDPTPDAALPSPNDMAIDAQGNIYISNQDRQHVKKFDGDGKFITKWADDGKDEGEINDSEGITVDGEGNIYVADFFNTRIQKYDSNGKFLMSLPVDPAPGPGSVAVDKQGNVYVLNFGIHDHYVLKLDWSGKPLTTWGSAGDGDGQLGATQATGPFDIAADQAGNIYVADRDNHRIVKFDSEGKFLAKFGGEASTKGNGKFFDPLHIAIDNDGNLYVLDSFYLQKLDAEGNFITQWATHGTDLDGATTVGVDWQGNIYATARHRPPVKGMLNVPVLKKFKQ